MQAGFGIWTKIMAGFGISNSSNPQDRDLGKNQGGMRDLAENHGGIRDFEVVAGSG